jgi:hypothetical protein
MSRVEAIFLFIFLVLAAGCDRFSFFGNYAECTSTKKAEYIDAGANAYDGESRAAAFCETKYPLVQPSYQTVSGVTVRVEHKPSCNFDFCDRYEFHLSQPVDLVTISVTTQGGQRGQFTKVKTYNGRFTWNPDKRVDGGPIVSAEVVEALVDINKGKHQGD